MAGLESVPDSALEVSANEKKLSKELAGLRAASEALFFKLFIAAKHPGTDPKTIQSRDYPEEMVEILISGVQTEFRKWWEDEESVARISSTDTPQVVAQRAYAAYIETAH